MIIYWHVIIVIISSIAHPRHCWGLRHELCLFMHLGLHKEL